MAPSLRKALKKFIDEIPAAKLENFPGSPRTLYKDDNFRLDLQGLTETAYNLQIQANKGASNTSVRQAAPQTVATVLQKFDSKISTKDIREAFHKSAKDGEVITIGGDEFLQIQANKGASNTLAQQAAPQTVAAVLRKFDSKVSTKDVQEAFHKSVKDGEAITIGGDEFLHGKPVVLDLKVACAEVIHPEGHAQACVEDTHPEGHASSCPQKQNVCSK